MIIEMNLLIIDNIIRRHYFYYFLLLHSVVFILNVTMLFACKVCFSKRMFFFKNDSKRRGRPEKNGLAEVAAPIRPTN